MKIPKALITAVQKLTFENPQDKKFALAALEITGEYTKTAIPWLAALVERKGAKFDSDNPNHAKQHTWPLS